MDKVAVGIRRKLYRKGVSIITPTGDRQICLSRLRYYIERQTALERLRKRVQWIVADDGGTHSEISSIPGVEIVHLKRKQIKDTRDSFLKNIRSAVKEVKYSTIVMMEDDDWYHPEYLLRQHSRVSAHDLVGEGLAHYYNVPQQVWRIHQNTTKASLCQTAFSSKLLCYVFLQTYSQSASLDSRLWEMRFFRDRDTTKFIFQDSAMCIGMKGLPGRHGIGSGHRPFARPGREKFYNRDPDFAVLKRWIGEEDANWYIHLLENGQCRKKS